MDKNILSMISLAMKAGKIVSGTNLTLKSVRNKKAKIVFISKDASERTIKTVTDKCKFYNIKYHFIKNEDELNSAIGKNNRKVIAIEDENFSNRIKELLKK